METDSLQHGAPVESEGDDSPFFSDDVKSVPETAIRGGGNSRRVEGQIVSAPERRKSRHRCVSAQLHCQISDIDDSNDIYTETSKLIACRYEYCCNLLSQLFW